VVVIIVITADLCGNKLSKVEIDKAEMPNITKKNECV
jgi:hypothetical protein